MAYFAVELVFISDLTKRDEARPRHREYLATLEEKGNLLLSGPWTSDTGALLVYRAEDEAEVREFVEHDPYSEAEVVSQVRITEWNVVRGVLAGHLGG